MTIWHQLVVHEDGDAAGLISDMLGGISKLDSVPVSERNFERAQLRLGRADLQWSLAVLSANAPRSAESRGEASGLAVRDFVRGLKASQPRLPIIVIVTQADAELAGLLSAYDDTVLMNFSLNFRDELERHARALASRGELAQAPMLEVEIALEHENSGIFRLKRIGRINEECSLPLPVDTKKLRNLRRTDPTRRIEEPSFREWMDETSLRLQDYLMSSVARQDFTFWFKFYKWLAQVGGLENTRFRFLLSPEVQDVMVEAIKDEPEGDFWMLKAPIVRQCGNGGSRPALYCNVHDAREPINCLVIAAHPGGGELNEAPWQGRLDPLPQALAEADAVAGILERAAPHGVAQVDKLVLDSKDAEPRQTVLKKLASRPWHLVHFVGHGLVTQNGAAGLVLSAEWGEVLNFAEFSAKLPDARFLFVSSCNSANTAFLTHATRGRIPATLGYRWRVNDASARRFAECFYEGLFEPGSKSFKSLEYAFLRARQKAWAYAAEDVTWASPLLLTQLQ